MTGEYVMVAIRCRTAVAILAGLLLAATLPVHADTDTVNTIRNDVRDAPPSTSTSQSSNSKLSSGDCDDDSPLDELKAGLFFYFLKMVGMAAASPIWVPHYIVGDDFREPAELRQFPYDDTSIPVTSSPTSAACIGTGWSAE
jgi:hypothetical protein